MRELLWILDHIRDVMADLRAVMHLGWADACRLSGPEFFALAYRLPLYPGALQAKAMAKNAPRATGNLRDATRSVPATRTAIMSDPVLASVVSFGGANA